MDEETIRGDTRKEDAEVSAPGGWTTTKAAGKALGVSPRTVQSYIKKGDLDGRAEGEGVKRTWYVSIDSLNRLRARRLAEGDADIFRGVSSDLSGEGIGEAIQNLSERLAEESARAAEFRTRLELTGRAESSLREDLDRERGERREAREELAEERRRREAAESEREDLRRQLEAAREAREAAERARGEVPEGGETLPGEGGPEERSWWRRFFRAN